EPGGADYLVSQKRSPGPLVAGSPPVWSILSGRQPSTPASDTGGAPPAPGAGTVPDAADGIQGTNTTVPESTRAPQERGLLTSSRSSLGVRHLPYTRRKRAPRQVMAPTVHSWALLAPRDLRPIHTMT